jgi:hypothetical protein
MTKYFAAALVMVAGLAAFSAAYAEGGCGWGWHRGPLGGCRPNGSAPVAVAPAPTVVVPVPGGAAVVYAPSGRACPIGYHLGPQGRRCWPN